MQDFKTRYCNSAMHHAQLHMYMVLSFVSIIQLYTIDVLDRQWGLG
jgi:hypothetical protein